MAALQTLRNKPALLMSVIGGALLLFIVTLTDLNSCSRPNVEAEVNGTELTYEDFENQVREEENLESLLLGSIDDTEKDNIREIVWEKFLQAQVLSKEASKLGIAIGKEEIQNELAGVTQQQLQQIAQMVQSGQLNMSNVSYAQKIMLLMARYLGQPSIEAYKQFMKSAKQQIAQMQKQDPQSAEMIMNLQQACLYCESQIPNELLVNKYMGLIALGITSNPVSGKMDYDENTTTVNMALASIPYATVADKDVQITDADLKAKYNECKELFRIPSETRDLKLIQVGVSASPKDRASILAEVKAIEDTLRTVSSAEDVEDIMRGAKSDVNFMNVYLPKSAYSDSKMNDVVEAIDSLSVGGVLKTKITAGDDNVQYVSTYKLVGAKNTPDSMQICQFAVDTKAMADQIIAAVNGGSTLSAEAQKHQDLVKKYQLKGDTTWNATKYYVDAKIAKDDTTASTYTDICQIPAGTTAYYTVSNQQTGQPIYVITTVLSTKATSEKYNIAIVKYPIKFSQETYNGKRRALFEFLAKNKTIEAIEKNAAKAGYTVIDRPNFSTNNAMNMRYRIGGEGVKQAFMWAFDDAKVGDVSQVFEGGKNSDQLLVVAVTAINDGKYRAWDNPTVKEQLRALVMQDKKAEKILASVKNVKDINAAKAVKGVDINEQATMPLAQIAAYEPVLAGAIERTAKGKFLSAIKGSSAVFMAQINDKTQQTSTPYNATLVQLSEANMTYSRLIGQRGTLLNALIEKVKVKDKRYKF